MPIEQKEKIIVENISQKNRIVGIETQRYNTTKRTKKFIKVKKII